MPIRVTIDGRQVEMEEGATILDAARQAGADIPTLCHHEGLESWTSCFLCVVQVEGRPNLTPSCVAPAIDGMVVTTDSPDIRAARRTALELLLSDHRGDCVAPCSVACPAGLDIPGFIDHLRDRGVRAAIALIKERIPLPATLGRICPRYCERVCRRRESENAIAVCALKRFAADADLASGDPYVPERAERTGKSVAVVGAGPAGLSAAFYLLSMGHDCRIYDSRAEAGGMVRYGVPAFRMPRDVLAAEADVIRRLGAEFQFNCAVGTDVTLDDLRRGHDAVFLAIGAQADGDPTCDGEESCMRALAFLSDVASGHAPDVGDTVVVLGGGNEAVDAARTAVRLGAKEVLLVWPKGRSAMPCFSEWVDAAEDEGVQLELETVPRRVEPDGQGGLTVVAERGGSEVRFAASSVVSAPDRRVNVGAVAAAGLKTTARGIAVTRGTFETNLAGVFAGGDAVTGPATVVRAVSAGRQAARCIDQYLRGIAVEPEAATFNVRMGRLSETDREHLLREIVKQERVSQTIAAPTQRRGDFREVVSGLSVEQAVREAERCLQCDCLARDTCRLRQYAAQYGASVNRFRCEPHAFERDDSSDEVVFEPGKCILCGICVRIAESRGEELGVGFSRRGFGTHVAVPFGGPLSKGLTTTLRLCAEACPTGALAFRKRARTEPQGSIRGGGSMP